MDYMDVSKRQMRPKPRAMHGAMQSVACHPRACYNRIDSIAPREFRGGELAVPTPTQHQHQRQGGVQMKNPLDSLWGTIISGLVLTVILYFVVKGILG
jgi:hypothetical protein